MNTRSLPDHPDVSRFEPAPPDRPLRKVQVLNAYFHDVTMDEVLAMREGLLLTLHVDMLMKLQKDREFYDILDRFNIITCDSQILYFATQLLGTPMRERVSGSDYFPSFYMRYRDDPSVTVFLLGGKPGVAELAQRNINTKVGRDIVVGTSSPPFDFDASPAEVDRVIDTVNASGATVLLVGLGGGRQEKFIVRYRERFLNVRLFLPLGGTIDYEAGTLRRPSAWVTNAGLEWLYRVVKEPRQRWRRYFFQQPPVIPLLIRQKLGRYRDPFDKA